jgi:hypothetical protein
MTSPTFDQIKAAWEVVAASRAAEGTPPQWTSWEELPPRQVTACRVLAALAGEFRAEDARTLGRAAHAAWRLLDDPSAQVACEQDDDEDEDVFEERAAHARKVDNDWTALAEALQETVRADTRAALGVGCHPPVDAAVRGDLTRLAEEARRG